MNTAAHRWVTRPENSTWGDFGADDQLGRLNLLTPAKVLEGMREVRTGRTFCLSLPLDCPGNHMLNPRLPRAVGSPATPVETVWEMRGSG